MTCENTMALRISVDSHIPLPPTRTKDTQLEGSLPEKVRVLANTAKLLADEGLDIPEETRDGVKFAQLAADFACDPEEATKRVSDKDLTTLKPASLIQADAILTEFGKQVVHSTTMLRHTITNKLLLETENPDPRVRLKALEMLGKISDVGLFAEKTEITVTHQTTDELRDVLREKLEALREQASEPAKRHSALDITDADFDEIFDDHGGELVHDDDYDDVDTDDLQSSMTDFDDED